MQEKGGGENAKKYAFFISKNLCHLVNHVWLVYSLCRYSFLQRGGESELYSS